ncbi:MAG: hypothetical protein ACJAY7_000283 [Pseudohongiellaceae bacterium]
MNLPPTDNSLAYLKWLYKKSDQHKPPLPGKARLANSTLRQLPLTLLGESQLSVRRLILAEPAVHVLRIKSHHFWIKPICGPWNLRATHLMTQFCYDFDPITANSDKNCQPSNVTFRSAIFKKESEIKYLLTYQ